MSTSRETLAVEQLRNTLAFDDESMIRHSTTEVNKTRQHNYQESFDSSFNFAKSTQDAKEQNFQELAEPAY